MESSGNPLVGFLFIFLIWILPLILSYAICKEKNRSVVKGLFVTAALSIFGLGWFAAIGFWLGLKKRSKETGMLIA